MGWELFVAWRHLRSKYTTGFISLISLFSIVGIAIGVAALIIVLSVMNGFEDVVRTRIIGMDAHIRLRAFHNEGVANPAAVMEQLEAIDAITGMSPYIIDKGMLRCAGRSEAAVLRGIDHTSVDNVSDVRSHIVSGELSFVTPGGQSDGIVLGRYLADKLACGLGDTLVAFSPAGMTNAFSRPQVSRFVVTGIFELGMFEYDDIIALIDLPAAAGLFNLGERVHGIEIRLDDLYQADKVKGEILELLGHYPWYPLTWFEMHKNLFSWMKIERWMMFTVLSLIIAVAAFNIVTTLIMIVLERRKEIGILKAMGAGRGQIQKIFVMQGLFIGWVGTLAGVLLGFMVCWLQWRFELLSLPPDVYFISAFPIQMQVGDFLLISTAALVISFLATLYPARKASRLLPVEAIRYE